MDQLSEFSEAAFQLISDTVGADLATYDNGSPIIKQGTLPPEAITSGPLPVVSYRGVGYGNQYKAFGDAFFTVNVWAKEEFESMGIAAKLVLALDGAQHVVSYSGKNIPAATTARILTSRPETGATNTPVELRVTAVGG